MYFAQPNKNNNFIFRTTCKSVNKRLHMGISSASRLITKLQSMGRMKNIKILCKNIIDNLNKHDI